MTHELDETTLARLLAAAHATADPAVLARARGRIAALAPLPRGLAWLGTPAALVGAVALFVVVAGLSLGSLRSDATASRDTSLVSALMDDDGSYGVPAVAGSSHVEAGGADTQEVSR